MLHNQPHPSAPTKRKHVEHDDELRATVVRLRQCGGSWAQIEAATRLPRSTARSMVEVATTQGRTHKKARGGNHLPAMNDDVKRLVCDLQAADNALRLQDIHTQLEIVLFATPPSLTAIWNTLDAAGFTTKQMQKHAAARNTLDMKQRRKQWGRKSAPPSSLTLSFSSTSLPSASASHAVAGRA